MVTNYHGAKRTLGPQNSLIAPESRRRFTGKKAPPLLAPAAPSAGGFDFTVLLNHYRKLNYTLPRQTFVVIGACAADSRNDMSPLNGHVSLKLRPPILWIAERFAFSTHTNTDVRTYAYKDTYPKAYQTTPINNGTQIHRHPSHRRSGHGLAAGQLSRKLQTPYQLMPAIYNVLCADSSRRPRARTDDPRTRPGNGYVLYPERYSCASGQDGSLARFIARTVS
ncbi:hypothetical protein EVAR_32824_1 [Eumeta japonica]|uniref:Uncharacterized protein n=1 Tax=Eumeta variegata TaxID=151549 RepID=A0A4C1WBJ7_EUMVA|nr:hypothetical protein EVAR_32824_1 [Eumeta japonica]